MMRGKLKNSFAIQGGGIGSGGHRGWSDYFPFSAFRNNATPRYHRVNMNGVPSMGGVVMEEGISGHGNGISGGGSVPSSGRKLTGRQKCFLFVFSFFIYAQLVKYINIPLQLYELEKLKHGDYEKPIADGKYSCKYLLDTKKYNKGYREEKARIGIVTFQVGMEPEMVSLSIENKKMYCDRHGYDLLWVDNEIENSRPAAWSKYLILRKYLDEYDYLLWIDMDALIANFSIRIEDFLQPERDIYISYDENDINTGVFILRSTDWTKQFLVDCYDQKWLVKGINGIKPPFKYEQRAMQFLYGSDQLVEYAKQVNHPPYEHTGLAREKIQRVEPCALNANVCEEFWTGLILWRRTPWKGWFCDNVYHAGDFVIHFAGKSPAAYRNYLITAFAQAIKHNYGY